MFFIKKEIEDHLTCKICDQLFVDPRMLPCGHTYCNDCLLYLANKQDSGMVACPRACAEIQWPDSGYPVNRAIGDLVQVKAGEVIQSSRISELKSKLKSIESKCQQIERSLQSGSDEIREHCLSLRNQIDLSVETNNVSAESGQVLNDQIKRDYARVIQQVDEYEIGCVSYYESISKGLCDTLRRFLTTTANFHSDAVQKLNQYVIKDQEVEDLVKSSDEMLALLKDKELQLQRRKLNYEQIKFEPSPFKSSCAGMIQRQDLVIEVTPIQNLDYERGRYDFFALASYSKANQVIFTAYELLKHDREIRLVEKKFLSRRVEQVVGRYTSINFSGHLSSFLHVNDEYILVLKQDEKDPSTHFTYMSKKYNIGFKSKLILVKTGKSREYLNHAVFGLETQLQAANSSHIFCLCQDTKEIFAISADTLNYVGSYDNDIPTECKAMQANDKCLFILHQHSDEMKLLVIPLCEGFTSRREITMPSLNYNQIKLISTNFLVAFDNSTNNFCYINTETLVIRKIFQDMDVISRGLKMSQDTTEKVILYDSYQVCAHFSVLDYRFLDDL